MVTLLCDMDIRWSSTYLMVDHVLELYPVCYIFQILFGFFSIFEQAIDIFLKERDLQHEGLSNKKLEVLADIQEFLPYLHAVQQTVSAEKTPMLTIALPLYEQLIQMYKLAATKFPKLHPAIKAAAVKLNKYLKKTRTTCTYALTMSMFFFPYNAND